MLNKIRTYLNTVKARRIEFRLQEHMKRNVAKLDTRPRDHLGRFTRG